MNSIHDIKLKDIEGMNKKHITARIEEDFIYLYSNSETATKFIERRFN